jgi:hypothetical protein
MIHAIIALLGVVGVWAYLRQHKQQDVPLDRRLRWLILRKYMK